MTPDRAQFSGRHRCGWIALSHLILGAHEHYSKGIATDLIIYSIVIPVLPFQLELKGYTGVSTLVGYLLFAYVCIDTKLLMSAVDDNDFGVSQHKSGGLLICKYIGLFSSNPFSLIPSNQLLRSLPGFLNALARDRCR